MVKYNWIAAAVIVASTMTGCMPQTQVNNSNREAWSNQPAANNCASEVDVASCVACQERILTAAGAGQAVLVEMKESNTWYCQGQVCGLETRDHGFCPNDCSVCWCSNGTNLPGC